LSQAWFPALVVAALLWQPAAAEDFPGPFRARVVKVIDGDTFRAEAEIWPGYLVRVNVRIRGIDAPEMHARCDAERLAARAAREELSVLLAGETTISNIAGAKYYGRVLADVTDAGGAPVADRMLRLGLARPYGGGRRDGWC
jgi:endonuclease YncB( thermonuclease family)